ncbi:MAG: hypothetical protein ACI9XZ_003359 [Alphaproteobacteria bacterium]|jgi:hypothetical protein
MPMGVNDARADDNQSDANGPPAQWIEAWAGGETLANSWSIYTGSTMALMGDIKQPGWRMRATAGYGQYSYTKTANGVGGRARLKLNGRKVFSDALIGYQFQWQRLIVKTFGGVTFENHFIDPRDPDNPVVDTSYGGKVALEAWLRLSEKHWLASDLSWASAFNTYKLGLRTGYTVLNNVDLGVETQLEGNDAFEAGRAGGFATWKLGDAALTVAGGATGDRDMRASHYGRVGFYFRF